MFGRLRVIHSSKNILRRYPEHGILSAISTKYYSKQVSIEDYTRQISPLVKSQPKSCPVPKPGPDSENTDETEAKSKVAATQSKCDPPINDTPVKCESPPEPVKCPPEPNPCQGDNSNDGGKGNSFLKWLIGGALVAGGIAGFMYYNNLNNSGKTSDHSGDASGTKKKDKIVEKFRSPKSSSDIPKHVPYLLIGGGTASFAAFRAIKSNEAKAKILVITDEAKMPYMRPPLSKEVWFDPELAAGNQKFKQWNGVERSLFYEPDDFYLNADKLNDVANGGVSIVRGYAVTNINVDQQIVTLDDGTEIKYDKCLLATGVRPRSLEIFERVPSQIQHKIWLYKGLDDFSEFKKNVEKSHSVAIVGGGFLGSELACSLANFGRGKNLKVYQLFHEPGNMGKVLPEYLSAWTTNRVREEGVEVLPKSQVIGVKPFNGDKVELMLNDGKNVIVDHVIVAVGTNPNVELAKSAGLEVDSKFGGFVVNAELEARSNLFVAGDVACFYDPKLGRRRVEHHDHAVVSGRLAGENMVGLKKSYKHQSMFWSDLGPNVGYEAIGLIDASLPTVAVFMKTPPSEKNPREEDPEKENVEENKEKKNPEEKEGSTDNTEKPELVEKVSAKPNVVSKEKEDEDFSKGVVFYMRDGHIVGILLWNVFNRINVARRVLMMDKKFDDLNEVAKLFDIYEQQN